MSFPALQAVTETLAWTLLHFLWQGVLIGAVYGAARQLSGAVRWRHTVALVALIAVLAAPMATFAWLQGGAGSVTVIDTANVASAVPATTTAIAAVGESAPVAADEGLISNAWSLALVAVWLLGALVITAGLVSDWRLIRRAIRHGVEPPKDLAALFARQMERVGLRRPVRLRLTARITVPGVYGLLRPVILLPTALALSLPREQLEALLLHELAHIRRADCIANVLGLTARTLLYFHPVVHWICRDLERTRETLCDDLVVELKVDRIGYARALSTAEEFRQQVPVPLLTATGGELTERVHRILALPSERNGKRDRAPLLAALTAIGVALVALAGQKTDALLSLARPEFRIVYQTLMAPELAAPQVSVSAGTPTIATPRIANIVVPPAEDALVTAPDAEAALTVADAPALPLADASAGTAFDSVGATPYPTSDPVLDADGATFASLSSLPSPGEVSAAPVETLAAVAPQEQVSNDADVSGGDVAAEAESGAVASQLRSLRRVEPYYPSRALRERLEGSVTVAFRIDDDGSPVGARVV